jgi:hypothetical protein
VLGVDGISDFNALHSGKQNAEVQLCAFDVLAIDGEDVRDLPLSMRMANLERLLRGRADGIFIRAIPGGLRHGTGGHSFEALRSTLSRRPIAALDQSQQPDAPCVRPGR